jgi:hypothetical protein
MDWEWGKDIPFLKSSVADFFSGFVKVAGALKFGRDAVDWSGCVADSVH